MKKLKALYGYTSHCFYSCDTESFENYLKSKKPLPTAKFDKYFNKIDTQTMFKNHDSNRSNESSLIGRSSFRYSLNDTCKSDLQERKNELLVANISNKNHKLPHASSNINIISNDNTWESNLSSSDASLPTKLINDLNEIWVIKPQPHYSAEVDLIQFFN